MTALTADLALDQDLLRDLKVHSRTSPLSLWLARHYEQLLALGRIGRWRSLCDAAMAAGLRNSKGGELTPAIISRVWSRLKQTRLRAACGRGEEAPSQPPPRQEAPAAGTVRVAPLPLSSRPLRDHPAPPKPPLAPQGRIADAPASARTIEPLPARVAAPQLRSIEEVRAIKRLTLGMMDVGFKKTNGYRREAREQQAALVAEAKELGLEHELPPLVFKDDD